MASPSVESYNNKTKGGGEQPRKSLPQDLEIQVRKLVLDFRVDVPLLGWFDVVNVDVCMIKDHIDSRK